MGRYELAEDLGDEGAALDDSVVQLEIAGALRAEVRVCASRPHRTSPRPRPDPAPISPRSPQVLSCIRRGVASVLQAETAPRTPPGFGLLAAATAPPAREGHLEKMGSGPSAISVQLEKYVESRADGGAGAAPPRAPRTAVKQWVGPTVAAMVAALQLPLLSWLAAGRLYEGFGCTPHACGAAGRPDMCKSLETAVSTLALVGALEQYTRFQTSRQLCWDYFFASRRALLEGSATLVHLGLLLAYWLATQPTVCAPPPLVALPLLLALVARLCILLRLLLCTGAEGSRGRLATARAAADLARPRPTSPDLVRPRPTSPDLARPRPTSPHLPRPPQVLFKAHPVPFAAFQPAAFRAIRRSCGVSDAALLEALAALDDSGGLQGGASGAFLFPSLDGSLVVKTLSAAEAGLLAQHAPQYATYFAEQPSSLINRFLGCYKMTLYAHTFHFAVLSSVFAPALGAKPSVCYDLKGSWVDRLVKRPGAPTLKDTNLRRDGLLGREPLPLQADEEARQALLRQLEADSALLRALRVMDYSLLLAVYARGLPADARGAGLLRGRERDLVVGIIDVLQPWDGSKVAERLTKRCVLRKDGRGISAVPVDEYRQRFMQFMYEIFGPTTFEI